MKLQRNAHRRRTDDRNGRIRGDDGNNNNSQCTHTHAGVCFISWVNQLDIWQYFMDTHMGRMWSTYVSTKRIGLCFFLCARTRMPYDSPTGKET